MTARPDHISSQPQPRPPFLSHLLPTKKSRACVPCHERKVRCDYANVGNPCSRCVAAERDVQCVLVPPRAKSSSINNDLSRPNSIKRKAESQSAVRSDKQPRRLPEQVSTPVERGIGAATESLPLPTLSTAATVNADDDAHLDALVRMSEPNTPSYAKEQPVQRVFEYFSDFNALSILNDSIGNNSGRRMVLTTSCGPYHALATERDFSRLDDVDKTYLTQKGVHDFPSESARRHLLHIFFARVYPYTPIVDRVQVYRGVKRHRCSTFLLYAMFSIAISYAPQLLIKEMGFISVVDAQKVFYNRARLLLDFGCERSQLSILQGCFLLSSFQNSSTQEKDFRFWFSNAAHMATQMGLHRQAIQSHLDQATYRLCRRIWWLVFQRDVLFSLAGFENVCRVHDKANDAIPLCEDDWTESASLNPDEMDCIPPTTKLQVSFTIENCRLAEIGARFIHLFGNATTPPSIESVRQIGEAITQWRHNLPQELHPEDILDWNDSNVWVSVLQIFSFRLECLLYRTILRCKDTLQAEDITWAKKRLLVAIFELNTMIRRAMAHEIVEAGPPSMIVCMTQLMALQVEMAMDATCTESQRTALRADIHAILSYVRGTGDAWRVATWASRLFEWVVNRTGLSLDTASDGANRGVFLEGI